MNEKELNRLNYLRDTLLKRYEYYKDNLYFEDYEYVLADIYKTDKQIAELFGLQIKKIFEYLESINEKDNLRLSKYYKFCYNIEKLNGIKKEEFHSYFKEYYLMCKFNNISDKHVIRKIRTFYKAK